MTTPPAATAPSMNHTVLTIEDQPDIRRLIRMTLEFKGFQVLEAGDGEQGLALARSRAPDLILLDVMMPGMDGLSVSKILAQDPALRQIPVVMISALGRADDVAQGLETGVRAYLVKPFSPWELLDLTHRLLNESKATS
ncbi:response regulator receiver domain-containing protein [Sphaerotilus hippei]|uniref:Response regulator receiver domain-containing protein n=1 Tax=Sphaerotilus hippei TaxID=744406 RepID=A0A318H5F4_9BURK|nr:response regulator [Sphaerotilus hippei]PXW94397.1 response regulator receiver domain-containing protein [Sphaerotilus hippei]